MDEMDLHERKSFLTQVELYLERNELPAVLDLAEERLKRIPGDLDARMAICRIWIERGRIDEARALLGEMEGILACLFRLYVRLGDGCLKKGMREEAERYYRKFIVLNPDAPPAGEILEKLKDIEEQRSAAEIEEEEGTRTVPSAFQTVTLAELYVRQGHLPLAAEVLEAILG